ncbi:MAG TPA: tetratricopeptide repeat protein [Polyangia bacterium]|jgi:tetratricopeptide (TPR) repeat protein|nr:tetratricopeptide repeat protein [Polyangia bacterium]
MRAALVFTVTLTLLAAGRPAASAPPSAAEVQSRQSFQTGEEHFKAGRFAEALTAYQAGYDLTPLPGFLINMAQCHRRLGDLTRARATYRKFILVAPDSPFVPQVKTLIDELDQLAIDLEGGAKPASENAPTALQAPDSETTAGAPGPALVAVPAAPAASSTSSSGHRWWLWGSVGGAVALAAAATFFVLRTPDATTVHDGTLGTLRR